MKKSNDVIFEFKKKNKKMMILSCIGIILVVLGHTYNYLNLVDRIFPIYSFHMVLFIFISGYFYNPEYEENIFGKNGYMIKNIKKLILPYFIWNFFYAIIINLANNLNIVTYGSKINIQSFFLKPWTNGHQYMLNLAAWFLLALFLVKISYILIRWLLKKIKLWNDIAFLLLSFCIALCAVFFSKKNLGENYIPILRTSFFILFYHFGYIYRIKLENKFEINTILYFLILVFINLVLLFFGDTLKYKVAFMEFPSNIIIVPILAGITGILFCVKISEILEPIFANSKIVNYISNNTFDIMMHHMFWIFITNVILWSINKVLNLYEFDIVKFKKDLYYFYTPSQIYQISIIYTIIALAMPLITKWCFYKFKFKVNEFIKIKNKLE